MTGIFNLAWLWPFHEFEIRPECSLDFCSAYHDRKSWMNCFQLRRTAINFTLIVTWLTHLSDRESKFYQINQFIRLIDYTRSVDENMGASFEIKFFQNVSKFFHIFISSTKYGQTEYWHHTIDSSQMTNYLRKLLISL